MPEVGALLGQNNNASSMTPITAKVQAPSDVCVWHLANIPTAPPFVRYSSNTDKAGFYGEGLSAFDPKRACL
jgi:hypothetical protein